MCPSTSTPAKSARPPVPVTVSAMRAPSRAAAVWCQYPISRKEKRLVSSQKKTSCTRFPDSTSPVIAPMKASRKAKKRGTGSSSDM